MQRYREQNTRYRRPFWLPASNFYVLACAATIAVFFLIWGTLHDGGDETPYIPAGLGASIVLAGAVIVREVIMRRARNRFLRTQQTLDRSISRVPRRKDGEDSNKLTLERNAALLDLIAQKSDAAKTLARLSDAHKEVFELCEEYIALTNRQLPSVGPGSPRLAAIRRGQRKVDRLRHYHLLQWAAIESKSLMIEAKNRSKITDRLDTAQKALGIIDFALAAFPNDVSLVESEGVVREFIVSSKISDLVEKAEKAAFKGNRERAIDLYKEALFELERAESPLAETWEAATAKIRSEIVQLEGLAGEIEGRIDLSNSKKKNNKRK